MHPSFNSLENFEFESLKLAVNYRKWIGRIFQPYLENSGSLLEVGAGIGQFTETILKTAPPHAKISALEPEAKFQDILKNNCPEVEILPCQTDALIGQRSFETIISINVLEHIEEDLTELKQWSHLLHPGGYICLLVPACPELYAPIDTMMGHYRRYTPKTLSQLMEQAELNVEKLSYFNFIGYWLWLLNFKLLKQRSIQSTHVGLYDHCIIHLAKLLDYWGLNRMKGQSLICIAQRP